MKDNKEILDKDYLSQDELVAYLKGKLDSNQVDIVQEKLENQEINIEAIEGYLSFPEAINDIEELKSDIKNKYSYSSKNNFWSYFTMAGFIIAIGSMWIAGINFIDSDNNDSDLTISDSTIYNNNFRVNEKEAFVFLEEIEDDSIITNFIKIDNPINSDNINKKTKKSSIKKIGNVSIKNDEIKNDTVSNFRNNNTISENNVASTPKVERKINEIKYNALIKYLNDFKIVNYDNQYKELIDKLVLVDRGVGAEFENKQDRTELQNSDFAYRTVYIPYDEFFEGIFNKMSKGKHQKAFSDIKLLMKKYPKDQNAFFYGGLLKFNIGDYKNAIELFDRNINSEINVFHQEALFYKALSLAKLNQLESAILILKQIIKDNSYYSERALQILEIIE